MNLSVETQQEVIFLEDLCKIFLLSFTVSTCLKMRLDTLKSQNFPGEHAPGPPFGSQISTPKTKILSTALEKVHASFP